MTADQVQSPEATATGGRMEGEPCDRPLDSLRRRANEIQGKTIRVMG